MENFFTYNESRLIADAEKSYEGLTIFSIPLLDG